MKMKIMLLLFLIHTAKAVTSGLTDEEIAAFSPINPDIVEKNAKVKGEVNIEDPGSSKSYLTVYSNGVPSHDTGPMSDNGPMSEGGPMPGGSIPHSITTSKTAFNIPKEPKLRDNPMMCVPFGVVGIATGGVLIYNAYSRNKNCPMALSESNFDTCSGHSDPSGGYHYHGHSTCNSMEVCGEPSKIFGVALDGIPIYGPFDENGKQVIQEDLDSCGGRVDGDGRYKYHVTADPPYLLNCFKGEIHKDLFKTSHPINDEFTCTCPFDDSDFPECWETRFCTGDDGGYSAEEQKAAESAFRERERTAHKKHSICDWENTNGDFATCTDNINMSYVAGFKQIKKSSTMNLIPCCPRGEDCGSSCTNNVDCYIESRTGMYLETVILVNDAVVVHLKLYTMAILILYLIL